MRRRPPALRLRLRQGLQGRDDGRLQGDLRAGRRAHDARRPRPLRGRRVGRVRRQYPGVLLQVRRRLPEPGRRRRPRQLPPAALSRARASELRRQRERQQVGLPGCPGVRLHDGLLSQQQVRRGGRVLYRVPGQRRDHRAQDVQVRRVRRYGKAVVYQCDIGYFLGGAVSASNIVFIGTCGKSTCRRTLHTYPCRLARESQGSRAATLPWQGCAVAPRVDTTLLHTCPCRLARESRGSRAAALP